MTEAKQQKFLVTMPEAEYLEGIRRAHEERLMRVYKPPEKDREGSGIESVIERQREIDELAWREVEDA